MKFTSHPQSIVFSKSTNPLDLRKNPQPVLFFMPNPLIRKSIHQPPSCIQPRPIITNYTAFSSRQLKQNRYWISGLFIVIEG